MLSGYLILCTRKGCKHRATYKIAARWSDGTTEELKTYALCCADCLSEMFRLSIAKQKSCRTARNEALEGPGIYLLSPGRRGCDLQRRHDLEREL
jgi:hypothetical protein